MSGKKREHGRYPYDFAPETLVALLRRHKTADYCVQSLRAIGIGWHVPFLAGILHAITRGHNAGDDIACNTSSASGAPPEASDPPWLVEFLASLAREDLSPATLRGYRYASCTGIRACRP